MSIPATIKTDILVIGGGAAGMAVSLAARRKGKRVLLAEHDIVLGGILNQCVHQGFGHAVFQEDLTGREYAARFIHEIENAGIMVCTGTAVLSVGVDRTALLSGPEGLYRVGFEQCVLAAGCLERTLESLNISGTRPAGVFTAGTAQQLMNRGGYGIGKQIVILGSGDIGQIMARQFRQAGLDVIAMIEQMDHAGGLARNRKECLEAFQIPLSLKTTVDEILGCGRITGVMARDLESGRRYRISCDTLVTAVGLIPDRTLCRELATPEGALPKWLHLSGNCESVHDIVDSVTREAFALGDRL